MPLPLFPSCLPVQFCDTVTISTPAGYAHSALNESFPVDKGRAGTSPTSQLRYDTTAKPLLVTRTLGRGPPMQFGSVVGLVGATGNKKPCRKHSTGHHRYFVTASQFIPPGSRPTSRVTLQGNLPSRTGVQGSVIRSSWRAREGQGE